MGLSQPCMLIAVGCGLPHWKAEPVYDATVRINIMGVASCLVSFLAYVHNRDPLTNSVKYSEQLANSHVLGTDQELLCNP